MVAVPRGIVFFWGLSALPHPGTTIFVLLHSSEVTHTRYFHPKKIKYIASIYTLLRIDFHFSFSQNRPPLWPRNPPSPPHPTSGSGLWSARNPARVSAAAITTTDAAAVLHSRIFLPSSSSAPSRTCRGRPRSPYLPQTDSVRRCCQRPILTQR